MRKDNYFYSMEPIVSKPKKGQIIQDRIGSMAYGGKGIVKINLNEGEYVIFISNTITGQIVKFKIIKRKEKYAEGRLIEIIKKSEIEKKIKYQSISGAPYSTLDIAFQQELKKSQVIDLMKRIGGITDSEKKLDKFIKSPRIWHYRNKMDYSFSSIGFDKKENKVVDEFSLGFKRINTWWIVENLEKDSGLFDKNWEDSLMDIKKYCISTKLPAWNIPQKKGFFRNIVVRKSISEDKLLIELITSSKGLKEFNPDDFVKKILSIHKKRIEGIIHTINDNISDRVDYKKTKSNILFGKNKINETINELTFQVSMSSFFQTNPKAAEKLYSQVCNYVFEEKINDGDVILDLFCGTGTITQIIAKKNKKIKVIGVEIVEEAINNAIKNAKKNNISNVSFFNGDIGKIIEKNPSFENKIKCIIIDPPRSGVAKKSLKKIVNLNSKRIVYISCDPSTQARDYKYLIDEGYELVKFSIIDQFPHTYHIETIGLLEKKHCIFK